MRACAVGQPRHATQFTATAAMACLVVWRHSAREAAIQYCSECAQRSLRRSVQQAAPPNSRS
eukprot:9786083-Alexandrium_andersonii.AAC.1